jgi:hypothetical protein
MAQLGGTSGKREGDIDEGSKPAGNKRKRGFNPDSAKRRRNSKIAKRRGSRSLKHLFAGAFF